MVIMIWEPVRTHPLFMSHPHVAAFVLLSLAFKYLGVYCIVTWRVSRTISTQWIWWLVLQSPFRIPRPGGKATPKTEKLNKTVQNLWKSFTRDNNVTIGQNTAPEEQQEETNFFIINFHPHAAEKKFHYLRWPIECQVWTRWMTVSRLAHRWTRALSLLLVFCRHMAKQFH